MKRFHKLVTMEGLGNRLSQTCFYGILSLLKAVDVKKEMEFHFQGMFPEKVACYDFGNIKMEFKLIIDLLFWKKKLFFSEYLCNRPLFLLSYILHPSAV